MDDGSYPYRRALARMEKENFRLELRVAELEHGQEKKSRDYVADFVAEQDGGDMECHRQSA